MVLRHLRLGLAIVGSVGCTSGGTASAPPEGGAPPPNAVSSAVPAGEDELPEPVSPAMIAKISAAAACAGPFARVRVYFEGNRVHRFAHSGDFQRCSHPPTVVFDRDGATVGEIPQRPMIKGSEAEAELAANVAKLFGGSKHLATFDTGGSRIRK